MNNSPSIFNDVIGPVMRGPSSSHTAASWRIASICLAILNKPLKKAVIDFDKDGAWATNYLEQGSVLGINGGLLGLDIVDDQMKYTEALAEELGIEISYEVNSFPTTHANTIRLRLESIHSKKMQFIGISTGGGAFEVTKINNFSVSVKGDYYEILIWSNCNIIPDYLEEIISQNTKIAQSSDNDTYFTNIKSSNEIPNQIIEKLHNESYINDFVIIDPILPIVSGNESKNPYNSINALIEYANENDFDLGDIGLTYEKSRSMLSENHLNKKMKNIINIIETSIKVGLAGTVYEDRILHQQSHLVEAAENDGKILKTSIINKIIANVTAIMESKSAMEVIVANPTAGSCGTIGGVLKAVADDLNSTTEELVKAYFAAGIIGAFFAQGPGFSAEEYGCQVECGAASGMAAAGIVQLMGGTAKQAIDAASMAIQTLIGMVCDPVADRVEVPCLGKNISAAMNALSSATMACSGFDSVIPLDEVIQTVIRVGEEMPVCVKCSGLGGLSVTDTSIKLKESLK